MTHLRLAMTGALFSAWMFIAPAFAQVAGGAREFLASLRAASCPGTDLGVESDTIPLRADPVPLQGFNPANRRLGELDFVAGFHLSSSDKRFGGLSGLDVLDNGDLLAVSDEGRFVRLALGADGVTPTSATLWTMRDVDGHPLVKKSEADSEGLAVQDGLALVSFERDHRVLAFDIAGCGPAARGAPIVFGAYGEPLAKTFDKAGLEVEPNQGEEALAVTPGWLLLGGMETATIDGRALSIAPIEDPQDFRYKLGQNLPPLVGLDALPAPPSDQRPGDAFRLFSLHRSTNPLSVDPVIIAESLIVSSFAPIPATPVGSIDPRRYRTYRVAWTRILAGLNLLYTFDNFEGIAARETADGRTRLYIVSDDNFSSRQRTLLMVFELK